MINIEPVLRFVKYSQSDNPASSPINFLPSSFNLVPYLFGALSDVRQHVSSLISSPSNRPSTGDIADTRKAAIESRMKEALTHEEWETAAKDLDVIEGNDTWQVSSNDEEARDWNPRRIKAEIRRLDEARSSGDLKLMVYLVRTALSRDLGGMGNRNLYRHSYIGTKSLIERYVDSAVQTIDAISDVAARRLPIEMTLQLLTRTIQQARQNFGRSALLLSGGATFGMLHIGVLKALHEADLLPRIISGASAGSIVCAVLCTRLDSEIPQMLQEFAYGHLDVFEKAGSKIGFIGHLQRLLLQGSWNDVDNLDRVMRGMIGDITFREAYNRSRRILNICVSTPSSHDMPRLLNYITAPNVLIRSAVTASCSVPLVFNPGKLWIKNPMDGKIQVWEPGSQTWVDGSLDNDLPMERLSEMFNVNHFIVSQVNPHIVPFLSKDNHLTSDQNQGSKLNPINVSSDWNYALGNVAIMEAIHRLQVMVDVGMAPGYCSKIKSILNQKYSGDINILPEINPKDLPCLLTNPTIDFMLRSCLAGEKATWPKIARIRERVSIEAALGRCLNTLKARVIASHEIYNYPKSSGSRKIGWKSSSVAFRPSHFLPLGLPLSPVSNVIDDSRRNWQKGRPRSSSEAEDSETLNFPITLHSSSSHFHLRLLTDHDI
ncbi:Lipase 5 [Ceratocystis pirilliformis]|uniref:Lipase 5 n=1 Tax=Ceratocystis pirilliformis TaxID=259994 RepID=A0ABR3ZEF3_9PEZI